MGFRLSTSLKSDSKTPRKHIRNPQTGLRTVESGDGFYTYRNRAFVSHKVAERWAKWVTANSRGGSKTGYNATIRQIFLGLDDDGSPMVKSIAEGRAVGWEQYVLLELLFGGTSDWKQTLEYCCPDGEDIPDWDDALGERISDRE